MDTPSRDGAFRWDPGRYDAFTDQRMRPGVDLILRIPDGDIRSIVDLGCGTGHLTAVLADRFTDATVLGIDASVDMIEAAARHHPALAWTVADIAVWEPDTRPDIVFSNAALHWLDDHEILFARLRTMVAEGGIIAVQMPDNWAAPTHRIPAEVLDTGGFSLEARNALLRDRVAEPSRYREWLQPAEVDLWRTTYHHVLTGPDPVWNWVTGSVLRPVLAILDGDDRSRFADECRARYLDAYPRRRDGTTVLPFSRVFMVARIVSSRP